MAKYVTVSTIAYNAVEKGENYRHDDFLARTHEKARTLIEQAAQAKPDIVCLPEVWNGLGLGDDMYEHAEPIPGPTTDMCAKLAKKHKMYIVCPIFERRGKKLYNTAAFIDRRGQVIGKYHKYQPTIEPMPRAQRCAHGDLRLDVRRRRAPPPLGPRHRRLHRQLLPAPQLHH